MPEAVRVVARFRPSNEWQAKTRSSGQDDFNLEFPDTRTVSITCPDKSGRAKPQPFYYDYVFPYTATQDDVFEQVATATLNDIFEGYNGTIFAYGQTGSGKSHTMLGPKGCHHVQLDEAGANINPLYPHRGLIPRIAEALFARVGQLEDVLEVSIACSFLEIYKEQIRDLLNPKQVGLRIRESASGECFVQSLTEEFVSDTNELLTVLRHGEKHRSVAATQMNEVSSRSHSVLIIVVTQKCADGSVKTGKLNLADLAGSERINSTGATGETLEEAKMINKSLSALGNCIAALTDSKRKHVPYRDSTLSYLLKDSLGGNTKTTLVICCSSDGYNAPETVSTLRFGARAKQVKNAAKVNRQRSVAELELIIANMRKEMDTQTKYIVLLKALITEMFLRSCNADDEKVKALLGVASVSSSTTGMGALGEASRRAVNQALDILLERITADGGTIRELAVSPKNHHVRSPPTSPLAALPPPSASTDEEDDKHTELLAPAPTLMVELQPEPEAETAATSSSVAIANLNVQVSASPPAPSPPPRMSFSIPRHNSATPSVAGTPLVGPAPSSLPRVSSVLLEGAVDLVASDSAFAWGEDSDEDAETDMWGGHSSSDEEEEQDPECVGVVVPPLLEGADALLVEQLRTDNAQHQDIIAQQTVRIQQLEANARNMEQDLADMRAKLADLQRREQQRLEQEITALKSNNSSTSHTKIDLDRLPLDAPEPDAHITAAVESEDDAALRPRLARAMASESALKIANAELEARIEHMKQTWASYLDVVMDTQALQQAVAKGPRVVKPVRAKRSFLNGSATPLAQRTPSTSTFSSPRFGSPGPSVLGSPSAMSVGSYGVGSTITVRGPGSPPPQMKRLPSLAELAEMDLQRSNHEERDGPSASVTPMPTLTEEKDRN